MSLRDRLLKKSTIEETAILKNSKLYEKKEQIVTNVPAINIALSGDIEGGMGPGLLQIAGESKRFKSKFAIIMANAFMQLFPEGAVLFYDSEFGTPESYFGEMNIDNIIHSPVTDIEELIHDITVQVKEITKGDKLFILLDSLGNLGSKKENDDAESGKVVSDMTRAKRVKSLFRIIGPKLALKDIYMVVINHTYKTMDMYPTDVVGGGTGTIYNSNGIWIITASKNRDSEKDLEGFDFTIKIDKSRFVKQESRIPITVSFDSGVDRWSGLLDMGVEAGLILRPTKQTYCRADKLDETFSKKQLEGNNQFWKAFLKETKFSEWVKDNYQYKPMKEIENDEESPSKR